MSLLIDINPWGIVSDLRAQDNSEARRFRLAYLRNGEQPLEVSFGEDNTVIRMGAQFYSLQVQQVLAGNQFNVSQNLKVLSSVNPDFGFDVHMPAFLTPDMRRRILYVHGLEKIDLVTPSQPGDLVFDNPMASTSNIMISSCPTGHHGDNYWEAAREFFKGNKSSRVYWNPGSKQVAGHMPSSVFDSIQGKVDILQLNEEEARVFLENNGRCDDSIEEAIAAHWTVETRGAEGVRLSVNSEFVVEQDAPRATLAGAVLKDDFFPKGDEVGCGDALLAGLIYQRETKKDPDPYEALQFANQLAGIQYYNNAPNLASVRHRIKEWLEKLGTC